MRDRRWENGTSLARSNIQCFDLSGVADSDVERSFFLTRLNSGLVRGWVEAPLDLGVYPPTKPLGGGGPTLPDPTRPPRGGVPLIPPARGTIYDCYLSKVQFMHIKPPKLPCAEKMSTVNIKLSATSDA
jgi:hypothetical protein